LILSQKDKILLVYSFVKKFSTTMKQVETLEILVYSQREALKAQDELILCLTRVTEDQTERIKKLEDITFKP
jgi:hypothetical protein